jgi:hypothetical protein
MIDFSEYKPGTKYSELLLYFPQVNEFRIARYDEDIYGKYVFVTKDTSVISYASKWIGLKLKGGE